MADPHSQVSDQPAQHGFRLFQRLEWSSASCCRLDHWGWRAGIGVTGSGHEGGAAAGKLIPSATARPVVLPQECAASELWPSPPLPCRTQMRSMRDLRRSMALRSRTGCAPRGVLPRGVEGEAEEVPIDSMGPRGAAERGAPDAAEDL